MVGFAMLEVRVFVVLSGRDVCLLCNLYSLLFHCFVFVILLPTLLRVVGKNVCLIFTVFWTTL